MMPMVQLIQQENGIAELLLQPTYAQEGETEPSISQAEIFADIINLARLDAKRAAEVHGVELSITRLTPQQAAVLIQNLVKGDSLELVDVFNAIEEHREALLEEALSEEEYKKHIQTKERMLYSTSGEEPDPIDAEAREVLEQQKENAADPEDALSDVADDALDDMAQPDDADEEGVADAD